MERILRSAWEYVITFGKWAVIAVITGLLSGLVGALFDRSVVYAAQCRQSYPWLLCLLPVAGLAIVGLYHLCNLLDNTGINHVISAVRTTEKIPILMAPLIFVSTVLTHLCGGSAGREGAALQLGGSIGFQVGRFFSLDEKDMSMMVLCGMSGVFAALFGTPLTAAFFAMEVISVGLIYYSGLLPCLISSITAYETALWLGGKPERFSLAQIPEFSLPMVLRSALLAVCCAGVSILFCLTMQGVHKILEKITKNSCQRIILGGFLVIALTFLVGSRDYNGAGMDIVARAIEEGQANPEAFLLKMIFTAVTIGAGYRGGEIVPTFFVGATLGCTLGGLLGMDAGFGAAIGLVALFCGMVNTPFAAIFLSVELFGGGGLLFFALACGISYMLSGYFGLYKSQKIMYSKLKAEYINIHVR